MAVQADGKIVIGGSALRNGTGDFDFGVARLNADGSPDATFGTAGKQTVAFDAGGSDTDEARALAIQPDGKVVLAGSVTRDFQRNFDFAVARLNADGSPDATFNGTGRQTVGFGAGPSSLDQASAVALQTDGKIVVAGFAARALLGNLDFGVARLNRDGSLDATLWCRRHPDRGVRPRRDQRRPGGGRGGPGRR